MAYCPKCGNTGVRLDGTPCDCQLPTDTIYSDLVGLDIPDQYQGVRFSRALVPLDCGDFYGKTMEELHQQITTLQLSNQNLCICAPPCMVRPYGLTPAFRIYSDNVYRLFLYGTY